MYELMQKTGQKPYNKIEVCMPGIFKLLDDMIIFYILNKLGGAEGVGV